MTGFSTIVSVSDASAEFHGRESTRASARRRAAALWYLGASAFLLLAAAGMAQTPRPAPTPHPTTPPRTSPVGPARTLPTPAAAPALGQPIPMGVIRPTPLYQKSMIAVPFFSVKEVPVETESLPRVIRRDLEISGFFTILDLQMANRQNVQDVRNKKIDWAKWQAMGVEHYLMGECKPRPGQPGQMTVLTYLYDVPSKSLVFGKEFYGSSSEYRDVAHQISDEVLRYLKNFDGIARTRIAYVTDRTGRKLKELAVMDADGFGQNEAPLTRHGKLCAAPCWGARGREIYFTSYRDYNPDLYGITIDGANEWYISREAGINTLANWSEVRQRIVFVMSKDGNSELYTCDRSGGNKRRLTTSKYIESSPCWSPDGSQIAFTSDREGGHPQIFLMNADGSNVRRLTRQGGWNDAASWSPKGDRIAFVSRSAEGTFDIYSSAVTGDNSTWRRLTMNQGDNETPSWAPDGHHLAFSSNRTGTWQIYVMLDDGSNQQQLTFTGTNQQPAWGPGVK